MSMNRRSFAAAATSIAAYGVWPRAAVAQASFPMVRILVGYPAGGTTDAAARRLGEGMRPGYAQAVVVDNRPGAAGRLALTELNRGPADGSVMVVQPEAVLTLVPHVDPKNSTFRLSDVAPVSSCAVLRHGFAIGSMVPVSVKTMREYLDWARANPSLANYGSPGANTPQRFLISALSRETKVELNHIPYKGSAPGIIDLIGGQVSAMCSPIGDALPHLKEGKLRLLAVASDRRSTLAPEVATFEEQGFPGMIGDETSGVVMPKGTAPEVLARAARTIAAVVALPEVAQAFARSGLEPASSTPPEYSRLLDRNFVRWGERVRASGFKPE